MEISKKFENKPNKYDTKKYSTNIALTLNFTFFTYFGYQLHQDTKNIKSMDNTLGVFLDLEDQYGPLTFEDFSKVANNQIFQKDFALLLKVNNYSQADIDKVMTHIQSQGFYNYALSYGKLQTAINGQENIFFREMFGEISQSIGHLLLVMMYLFYINGILKRKY